MMKASELVSKVVDIARNYKTLYVMGCFGAPMTAANKTRYINNGASNNYNAQATRKAMINAATEDTFGFDCVNLIKGVLWGWCGNKAKTYGGATYTGNGVPDIGADQMITKCVDASTSGWDKLDPGEVVWTTGHIGVYIGDGLAVECTPKWKNCVQITAVKNIGTKSGYNARTWKKHGHLPYVEYDQASASSGAAASSSGEVVKATGVAQSFDKALAGTYTVTASSLNVRNAAGTTDKVKNKVLVSIPKGTQVKNYGYYSVVNGVKWLYVQFTYKNVTYTGFCSSAYLKK